MQSLLSFPYTQSIYVNVLGHIKLHSVLERKIHIYEVFMANVELVLTH